MNGNSKEHLLTRDNLDKVLTYSRHNDDIMDELYHDIDHEEFLIVTDHLNNHRC